MLMKRLLEYASSDGTSNDGWIWAALLVLCEYARVFFFTLTWGLSYR